MVSSINHSLPGTLHSLHSSYLSHPHAKLYSPFIPPLHLCHWMFWRNIVVWLQTPDHENEVEPEAAGTSAAHPCPVTFHSPQQGFTTSPSSIPNHLLPSSLLVDDPACFTGNGRNQTRMSTSSYPHIHPLTRQHLQAHALLPACGVELPAAEESYILPHLCSMIHLCLLKHIPPALLPSPLDHSYQHPNMLTFLPFKKEKASYWLYFPSSCHPFPHFPLQWSSFKKLPIPAASSFFLPIFPLILLLIHFNQAFMPNRLSLTRSPVASMLLNQIWHCWTLPSPYSKFFLGLPGHLFLHLLLLSLIRWPLPPPWPLNIRLTQTQSLVFFSPSKFTS